MYWLKLQTCTVTHLLFSFEVTRGHPKKIFLNWRNSPKFRGEILTIQKCGFEDARCRFTETDDKLSLTRVHLTFSSVELQNHKIPIALILVSAVEIDEVSTWRLPTVSVAQGKRELIIQYRLPCKMLSNATQFWPTRSQYLWYILTGKPQTFMTSRHITDSNHQLSSE